MRTRYPVTRILVTLGGLNAAFTFGSLVCTYATEIDGLPGCLPLYHYDHGFSVLQSHPRFSLITSSLNLTFFMEGAALAWILPRLGTFLTGMGCLSYTLLALMSSVPAGRDAYCGSIFGMLLFPLHLLPALWFFRACVGDEPESTQTQRRRLKNTSSAPARTAIAPRSTQNEPFDSAPGIGTFMP
jgi:hypothetical protein